MRNFVQWGRAAATSLYVALIAMAMVPPPAVAGALTQMQLPSGVDANSDLITMLQGLVGKIVLVIVGLIGFSGFVVVAWSAIHKFQECVHGKAGWGTLGMIVVVGIVILLFDSVLLYLGYKVFSQ